MPSSGPPTAFSYFPSPLLFKRNAEQLSQNALSQVQNGLPGPVSSTADPVNSAAGAITTPGAILFGNVASALTSAVGAMLNASASLAINKERGKAIDAAHKIKARQLAEASERNLQSHMASYGASGFTVGSFGDVQTDLLMQLATAQSDLEFQTELQKQDLRIDDAAIRQNRFNEVLKVGGQFGKSLLSLEIAQNPDFIKPEFVDLLRLGDTT